MPEIPALNDKVQHDPIGARQEIDAALALDPDNISLIEARIRTYLRCYDMPSVVEATQQALAKYRTPNLYFWLGGALMHLGNSQAALAPLTKAAELLPSAAILDVLARCQHRLGLIAACITTLRQAVTLPEEALTPLYADLRGLAYALRDAGQWREADLVIQDLLARHRARPFRVAPMALNFDIAHPYPGWRVFLNKASLAATLADHHRRHPELAAFAPESFRLPQDRDALIAWRAAHPGAVLAIKPNDLFGGQGISLTRGLPPESAKGCVAQRYIDPPMLIDVRKFHLRLYLLITLPAPLRAYLWHEGIVRLAPEPYANDDAALGNLAAHITNTALHKQHAGLVISDNAAEEDHGHVRSLSAVLRRLYPAPDARAGAWHALRDLAKSFVSCAADIGIFRGQVRQHTRWCLPPVLFALDVVLDRSGRPWLLEVQYNPAFTGSPLVNRLHGDLFNAAFHLSAYPMLDHPDADAKPLNDTAIREAVAAQREAEFLGGFERI